MNFEFTEAFAHQADTTDSLQHFRDQFHFPQHLGSNCLYFTGNSLGLQPKTVKDYVQAELDVWASLGVEGHFTTVGNHGHWFDYHKTLTHSLSKLVGAQPTEVVAMNHLTVNLHLLLSSFYRPTAERFKIVCEQKPFPSDMYAFESVARLHGLNPDDVIVEVPYSNGYYTDTQTFVDVINTHGNEVAVVLVGGVNYYTGQFYNLQAIAQAAHSVGAYMGTDLAHAIGNVPLQLHDWNVDFACWCTYKYLNSGPGGVGGAFVHQKHHHSNLPRQAGWWGHAEEERFKMLPGFTPTPTAEGWQLSNAPVLSMAAHRAALALFDEAGVENLRTKSLALTGYLVFCLNQFRGTVFSIITPENPAERGCQLSLLFKERGKEVFDYLQENGVIADWRNPNVIRVAPVPLYNSFADVYQLANLIKEAI